MVIPMSEPVVAVILAAGQGTRFGGPIPKTVLSLTGKAVAAVAVESMAAGGCTDAVLVVRAGMHHRFQLALSASPIPVYLVTGGESRQESALLGLRYIERNSRLARARIVLIHDAARPLVPANVVENVISAVGRGAVAVTPAVSLVDSIRQIDQPGSHVVDRRALLAIQTPQGFDRRIVTACHERLTKEAGTVTDDVSCCERYGYPVDIVKGSRLAIKITEPVDLPTLEALAKASAMEAGHHKGRRLRRMLGALRRTSWRLR